MRPSVFGQNPNAGLGWRDRELADALKHGLVENALALRGKIFVVSADRATP